MELLLIYYLFYFIVTTRLITNCEMVLNYLIILHHETVFTRRPAFYLIVFERIVESSDVMTILYWLLHNNYSKIIA